MNLAIPSPDAAEPSLSSALELSGHCDALTAQHCAQLQAEWVELAEASSEPNIFQFPFFLANSLDLLAGQSAKLVTIREAGLLVGVVILRRDSGYGKLPIPFWRSALHHEQFLNTPLVRAGYEDRFAAGLCAWLDNAPRDCSFVKLSMISADGPIALAIADHCSNHRRRLFAANRFERAAIEPMGRSAVNVDDLLSANRRKSIRRSTKRLAIEGEVVFARLSDPAELDDWTAHFLALENTGWKHDNGSSILSCEHETALYKAMISQAFEAGNLHFSRLCLDGQPIAYTLDIKALPISYCLKSAIDQRYRKFSPGVLMEYETLKHYLSTDELTLVDSCSAPDNAILNELWPDRKAITDLVIARKGVVYTMIFRTIQSIKTWLNTAARA